MDLVDKIIKEWSWRCAKGYPQLDSEEDLRILKGLLNIDLTEASLRTNTEIVKEEEESEITVDTLMDLLKARKDDLPAEFVKNLYTQIQGKGQGISSKISEILTEKGMEESKYLVLLTTQRLNAEEKLLKYLQSDSKPGLTDLRASAGGGLVDFFVKQTNLPTELVQPIVDFSSVRTSKGVGKGEYGLALFMKDGAKRSVGDVDVEGVSIEIKADLARLGERHGNLKQLIESLEQITQIPEAVNLAKYLEQIGKANLDPATMTKVREAVNREFQDAFAKSDLTSIGEIRNTLYGWYVDNFYATEPSDLILLYMQGNYKVYSREEFKAAVLSGEIKFKNDFSKSNKAPQLLGF